jgi:hypothetical protein
MPEDAPPIWRMSGNGERVDAAAEITYREVSLDVAARDRADAGKCHR